VGRVWFPIIWTPKKNSTKRVMATAKAMMERPMMAEVILSRASLALALSPADVIHWKPPQIMNTKTRMDPMMMPRRAREVINVPILVMEKLGGWENVKGEDVAAKMEGTISRDENVRVRNAMRRESIYRLIVVVSRVTFNG